MLGVSREMLLRRLLTFERTTQEFYSLKRAQYNSEYQAMRKREKEQPNKENEAQHACGNGQQLWKAVSANVARELSSGSFDA
jgi:hypothetical protein